MEIRLRRKYACQKSAKNSKTHSDNAGKKRIHKPPSDRERQLNARQPVMVMHMLPSGKTRMVRTCKS